MTLAWAVLLLVSILAQHLFPDLSRSSETQEPARDPAILEALWQMFERARYGHADIEQAAFVVVAPDGSLALRRWPASAKPHQSRWNGPPPLDAIAIVHTHPNAWPYPSARDHLTAAETRLAVYVITRSRIVKTKGTKAEVIAQAQWWLAPRHARAELAQRRTPPAIAASSR
jgi:hypothetical protein